jgi:ABC-2 type transport system permease protein
MTEFTGTRALLRLALRRDRVQLPIWLVVLTAVMSSSISGVTRLYGTEHARINYATTTATSAVTRAFNGPTAGPSLGAIALVETYVSIAVLLALMTTFAMVRHTRQNEETGRAELVGAGVLGRYAMLTAALLLAVGVNVVFGVLAAAVMIGAGLPATGSLLTGAAFALTGIAFAGVAAVTAQVAESARAANGLAAAVLGAAFVARALGDATGPVAADGLHASSAWLSWLSPLSWGQQARPFEGDRWWLLALPAGFAVIGVAVAFTLTRHRDVGTGMLPVRRGPATAPASLSGPLGLAWRLQRGVLLGWSAGMVVLGLTFGAVANEVDRFIGENQDMADLIAKMGGSANLVDAYFSATLGILGVATGGYAVQAMLRLRAEETGPLEAVLATAVGRPRWMASHLTVAVVGSAFLLLVAGASAGLAYGLTIHDLGGQFGRVAGAALVRLPAVLVLGGLVAVVFGALPRFAAAAGWGVLAACLLVAQIGALLDLPQFVMDLSPFTHVPGAPAVDVTAGPLVALTVTAAALTAAGMAAFQRRDLTV